MVRVLPTERVLPNAQAGSPLPESKSELPPVIRRAEVVAFALVALLIICVVAVLWAARAFFLPVVMAFVVGTMLSPAANFLERYRIPRSVGAVLIVTSVAAGAALMVGLISSPLRSVGSFSTLIGASPTWSLPLQVQPATISLR
jgi:predicted PurR-regulated permease PerM